MATTPENTLFAAVKAGDVQRVRAVVNQVDASSINVKDEAVCAPVHYAACLDSPDILQILIGAGADVNIRDEHEWTPLHHAAFDGKFESVKCVGRPVSMGTQMKLSATVPWFAKRRWLCCMALRIGRKPHSRWCWHA